MSEPSPTEIIANKRKIITDGDIRIGEYTILRLVAAEEILYAKLEEGMPVFVPIRDAEVRADWRNRAIEDGATEQMLPYIDQIAGAFLAASVDYQEVLTIGAIAAASAAIALSKSTPQA